MFILEALAVNNMLSPVHYMKQYLKTENEPLKNELECQVKLLEYNERHHNNLIENGWKTTERRGTTNTTDNKIEEQIPKETDSSLIQHSKINLSNG